MFNVNPEPTAVIIVGNGGLVVGITVIAADSANGIRGVAVVAKLKLISNCPPPLL